MHHGGVSAYARVAQTTSSPRELEAQLLIKAALRLQAVRDGWAGGTADHADALAFNRKAWTVLATDATDETNPIAPAIKASVAQLAAFIFTRTIACLAEPAPEKLGILIQINRDIAAGLRGSARAAAA